VKLNRFTAFTLGVIVTAVSVSAVSYVNALNDKPIKACANRKTGVMRYIVKGRCKRTERTLRWNQVGPQGIQGTTGATGAQGPSGLAGAAGINGTSGTSLYLEDANGKRMGRVIGDDIGGAYSMLALYEGKLWRFYPNAYAVQGSGSTDSLYPDSLCTRHLGVVALATNPSPQLTFGGAGGNFEPEGVYESTGVYSSGTDMTNPVYRGGSQNCTLLTSSERQSRLHSHVLVNLRSITPPVYSPPLIVVER
jgi:hypothetical protein